MSSQPTYDQVPVGKGARRASSPTGLRFIGTDGLATCLGVHIRVRTAQGDSRFVAHFDSAAEPKKPTDPLYERIVEWMAKWFGDNLGKFDPKVHLELATYSTGTFNSTKAMHAGVARWAGGSLTMTQWLGFQAPFGEGQPTKIPSKAIGKPISNPEYPCSVPPNP